MLAPRRRLPGLGLSVKDLKCVGITNQRETTIVWDKQTGPPSSPRHAPICVGSRVQRRGPVHHLP